MTTTVADSTVSNLQSRSIRLFDARRDLGSVADLIEICFADTLDPDGSRYIQRMRSAANDPNLLRWAAISAEWGNRTMGGYVWEENGRHQEPIWGRLGKSAGRGRSCNSDSAR